jgi:hypothetical protein
VKKYKLPSSDHTLVELIQESDETFVSVTYKLLNFIQNKEELSDHWKESIISPIHYKGDKTDCSNYRAISLFQLHTKFYGRSFSQG